MCNFDRVHYEKYLCEIIFNLDQWFRRCHFKIFLLTPLVAFLFGKTKNAIYAIWVETNLSKIYACVF